MKRFFNTIPGKNAACILLYGDIGEYSDVTSGDIARELIEAEQRYHDIDVRINSNGGEVYAGIAIFNAFRASGANITIYIDGIAASIASVIAACGKPVKMSKYARLMIHCPTGGTYGNSKEIDGIAEQLRGLEDTLCDIYAGRCGKSKEEIRTDWFDGQDHWFTAAQALELGLVDEVYDADPVPEDSTPEQVYTIFNNRLDKPQNDHRMNFEALRKRPSFANCATDEDVLRHIDSLEAEAGKVPALEQQVTDFETRQRTALETEDDALLDAAEDDGRITNQQRTTYKALMGADRINGRAALNSLKPKRSAASHIATPGAPGDKGAWATKMEEITNRYNTK